MERTHEEETESMRAGREGRHSEAAFAGEEPLSKLFDEVENSSGAKTAANSSAAGRVKNEEDQCPSTRSIG